MQQTLKQLNIGTKGAMMKIEKISIRNLKAIKNFEVNLHGATIVVRGNNNAGKSTFLKSIPDRIRGIRPSSVVNFKEDAGHAILDLDDGSTFQWMFDNKGYEKLEYYTPEGLRGPVTREIAKKYFPEQFDIDKFLAADPKTMTKTLLNLAGIDVSPYDAEYKRLYDERTDLNRQVKKLESVLDLSKLDLTLPKEEINSAEYLNLYTSETQKATVYENRKRNLKIATDTIESLQDKIAELRKSIAEDEEFLNNPENIPADNLADIKSALDNAAERNILIRKNNETLARKEELEDLRAELETIADGLVKNEAAKKSVINSMKLPEGFEICEGDLKYKGFALEKEQLSTSSLYIAALKLALLSIGEVHSLYFDASPLDPKSLQEVIMWGNDNNIQLLIETPADTDGKIIYQLVEEVEAPKVEVVGKTIETIEAGKAIKAAEEIPVTSKSIREELGGAITTELPEEIVEAAENLETQKLMDKPIEKVVEKSETKTKKITPKPSSDW